jgi:hypothetical protein
MSPPIGKVDYPYNELNPTPRGGSCCCNFSRPAAAAPTAIAQVPAGRPGLPGRLDAFTPFLAFSPAVRKLLYTTNSESLNYQLRKVTKAGGHYPADDAAVKLLWLAIINIEDKRARERAARRQATGKRSDQPARLVEGQRTMGWREALTELDNAYPGRLGQRKIQVIQKYLHT